MNRTFYLGTLLVALLACAAALSKPAPLQAILCCDNGGYQTSQYWVKAPTCAEAQAAFRAMARPEANAFCGGSTLVCAITVPPCYFWGYEDPANPWVASGVMTFGCKETCPREPIYP
jgi:hypothetical protein